MVELVVVLVGVGAEGVLRVDLHAGEIGRDVRDHVVKTRSVARTPDAVLTADFAPAGAERGEVAADAVGVGVVKQNRRAAETEFTVAAHHAENGFAVKELAVDVEGAVIGVEAVFEHKAHLKAVAEVFRALEAEARARVVARGHFECVDGVLVRLVAVGVRVAQAEVNLTVKGDVGSESGAGEGAENSKSSKGLFHL